MVGHSSKLQNFCRPAWVHRLTLQAGPKLGPLSRYQPSEERWGPAGWFWMARCWKLLSGWWFLGLWPQANRLELRNQSNDLLE
jgi:hypothetical protein